MDPVVLLAQEAETLCRRLYAGIEDYTLQRHASELRRRLWAAQSAFERFASFWLVLARENFSHYGQTFAAIFLLAGVTGMPPVHAKDKNYPPDPAQFMAKFNELHGHKDWKTKVGLLLGLLPSNYGADISKKVYDEAIALTRDPIRADNIFSKVFETIWKGGGQHIKPESYASAIKYLKVAVKNTFLNEAEQAKKHRTIDDPEKGPELIAPTPGSEHYWQALLQEIKHNAELRRDLERIPKARGDAVKYLELLAQGYDEKEIIGDYREGLPSMLPHIDQSSPATGMTVQNWMAHIKPTILEVTRKHLMKHYERQAQLRAV